MAYGGGAEAPADCRATPNAASTHGAELASTPALGMAVRRCHDHLGWKAKDDLRRGGVCSGAIYRTTAFIKTAQAGRNGSRRSQTVHIEHTVPASALASAWRQHRGAARMAYADAYGWLLVHSVATAFHISEKGRLGQWESRTLALEPGSEWFGRPFRRYDKHPTVAEGIWNVITGERVDAREWTFVDHYRAVVRLLQAAAPGSAWSAAVVEAGWPLLNRFTASEGHSAAA